MITFFSILSKGLTFPTPEEEILFIIFGVIMGFLLDMAIIEGFKSLFKKETK